MHRLIDFRVRHEQKLVKLLKKKAVAELAKRIRRAAQNLRAPSNRDPLVLANEILRSVSTAGPLSDEILHRYRMAVKRARNFPIISGKGCIAIIVAGRVNLS